MNKIKITEENITSKKFLESIYDFAWKGLSIQDMWRNGEHGHNAVFLNYNHGFEKGGEYVKIYCDSQTYTYPNIKITIYLLNREHNNSRRDFLLKTFNDFKEYKNYVEKDLFNEIKKLNDTKRKTYDEVQ